MCHVMFKEGIFSYSSKVLNILPGPSGKLSREQKICCSVVYVPLGIPACVYVTYITTKNQPNAV